ncbi:Flp pilus assembly protein CpaB [Pseudomonas sp. FW300-N2F2]|uniref:Flp pilus assembly protein CpaB n=1 Tax=Pseudomonas sp. FW300-N2F2 TaxID=2751320 RepID=UPI001A92944A|nr:Flp pilus assembly protein CpaB [Pseudomonas sp. FW300-N2F2]
MKTNSVILLAGAVILAAGTALVARALLTPPPVKAPEQVAVPAAPAYPATLAAARDLQPGEFLDNTSLRWVDSDSPHPQSLYFIQGTDQPDSLFGATVRQAIKAGTPLTSAVVLHPGDSGFLGAVMRPGMRAISVPTTAVESSSGLVAAGDKVDVILSLKAEKDQAAIGGGAPFIAAQTILRNVRVLALNNHTLNPTRVRPAEPDSGKKVQAQRDNYYDTVTLEVPPVAAERLAVAKEIGSLQLALRSPREESGDEPAPTVTTLRSTTSIFPKSASSAQIVNYHGQQQQTIELAKP